MSARHPVRRFYGEAMQTQMSMLLHNQENLLKVLTDHKYSGRTVLGYKLPEWQRKEVWSEQQCVRFIESVWLGVNLGTFMVNESSVCDVDVVLLDGQQRLTALAKYWNGDFPITGEDGIEYSWSELQKEEQAQFLRIPFPWVRSHYDTVEELKEAYNRHNFGGTAHLESERA